MVSRISVVHEDDRFRITRHPGKGFGRPVRFKITAKKDLREKSKLGDYIQDFKHRVIELTIDELFDLTEHLDDICDHIEDEEDRHRVGRENSQQKQSL